MISQINIHYVTSISVEYKSAGGCTWQAIRFMDERGEEFEVSAFVKQPLPIQGAELIALMAQPTTTPPRPKRPSLADTYGATLDKDLAYFETGLDELGDVLVGITYSPGSPGCHTLPNGDPGYPDEPAELEVCEVWANGVEISAALRDEVIERLHEKGFEHAEQMREDALADAAEYRAEARRDAAMDYA